MIYGEINRQRLKLIREHVVADTIDYLEMKFMFQTDDWDGFEKWAHFAKNGTVYDIRLTEDCIRKEDHLNLSAGLWKVYLHGNEYRDGEVIERITTDTAVLEVRPTGTLDGEPFPEMPASVTEQILARLENVEQNGGSGGTGINPEVTVERTEDGAVITIRDKNGVTSARVYDGEPGVYVGSETPPPGTKVWVNPDGEESEDDAVRYVPQELTPEQRAQARRNIDAAAQEEVDKLSEAIAGQGKRIPKVFQWANAELPFTESEISGVASGGGFVVNPTNFADGETYFRYNAGSSYGFRWTNPNPQKGSLTITMRGYSQYSDTLSTKIVTVYTDGTDNSLTDMMFLKHGETVTYVTDPEKTVSYIRGNYDFENWVLLDMDVLSIVADYPAPTGPVKSVNGNLPDENGNVQITIPSGGGSGGTDITLGISGATVGQIARITAVDDAGVPTAWEAVEIAGGAFELIESFTSTEAMTLFERTETPDGKKYKFTHVKVVYQNKNKASAYKTITYRDNNTSVTVSNATNGIRVTVFDCGAEYGLLKYNGYWASDLNSGSKNMYYISTANSLKAFSPIEEIHIELGEEAAAGIVIDIYGVWA